jgi:hypothetical protein
MPSSVSPELSAARAVLAPLAPHLTTILDGAAMEMQTDDNPMRFHHSGADLRELLREYLEEVAPDKEILRCSWFEPNRDVKPGVTRRHRCQFAVYRYLDPEIFHASLIEKVETIADDFMSVTDRLNKLAHVTKTTINPEEIEAHRLFNEALSLLARFDAAIGEAHAHLKDGLESTLILDLSVLFSSDFFNELDQLSTHTRPQDADSIVVTVVQISAERIEFTGTGSVNCDLQYGSDGDCSRGDGAEWSASFPFSFSGHALVSDPHKVSVRVEDIEIDTSSYANDDDEPM